MFTTTDKNIACAPFVNNEVRSTLNMGVALMDHQTKLEKTTIVFPSSDGDDVGTEVFLFGECVKHKWASEVYVQDGVKFILVPKNLVVAFKVKG